MHVIGGCPGVVSRITWEDIMGRALSLLGRTSQVAGGESRAGAGIAGWVRSGGGPRFSVMDIPGWGLE